MGNKSKLPLDVTIALPMHSCSRNLYDNHGRFKKFNYNIYLESCFTGNIHEISASRFYPTLGIWVLHNTPEGRIHRTHDSREYSDVVVCRNATYSQSSLYWGICKQPVGADLLLTKINKIKLYKDY